MKQITRREYFTSYETLDRIEIIIRARPDQSGTFFADVNIGMADRESTRLQYVRVQRTHIHVMYLLRTRDFIARRDISRASAEERVARIERRRFYQGVILEKFSHFAIIA